MFRKMAVKIQHVQTLCDVEHWYLPNAGIKVYSRRKRSRCNNWFELEVFESFCQPSGKSQ